MKLIVDAEGHSVINQLCDIALKHGGLQNLKPVAAVLSSTVEEIPAKGQNAELGRGPKKEEGQNPVLKEETEGRILKNQKLNE